MHILGIDIGGSGIKGAPVDVTTGEILQERVRIPTPQPSRPEAVAEVVAELARSFNWSGPIGVGFPALVRHGVVWTAANISKKWVGTNAEDLFTQATGCPTTVLNDADAAGIAEMTFGAGRGRKGSTFIITIGTGLGTALFIDQTLVPNLEFGHMILDGQDAELFASDATRKREDLSWKKWGKRFNRYLEELERLFSPDLFILGGGVSKTAHKFLPYLNVKAEVVPAKLLNQAGIIGAALYAGERSAGQQG
jgi:polyphosphate glucokinase